MGFAKAIQNFLTQQTDLEIVGVIQSREGR
jgi:hypothetical protein